MPNLRPITAKMRKIISWVSLKTEEKQVSLRPNIH